MYYTKYRPQTFSEISKPNDVAEALMNQVKAGKTIHAYLFVGPRGTGKTTTARVLSKALNCKNLSKEGDPCNECEACVSIKGGTYLDLIEIDAASNRGIDDIRDLREKIKLAPSSGKNKVYIIDEVHMLTPEAFNALLKTLEEPPEKVTFILCTTELHKVPDTIKSRCQIFKFKRATIKQLTEKLKFISQEENVNISEQELRQIASAAHGGFRDAENILQQVVEGDIDVSALTNLGSKEAYADFTELLINKETKEALHYVKKLFEDGTDLYVWLGELLGYLRELLFLQVEAYDNVEEVSQELDQKMKEQAKMLSTIDVSKLINTIIAAQNSTKDSFITQLPLEIAVVSLCQARTTTDEQKEFKSNPVGPLSGTGSQPDFGEKFKGKDTEEVGEQDRGTEKSQSKTDKNQSIKSEGEKEDGSSDQLVKPEDMDVSKNVDLEIINKSWTTIISQVDQINSSVSALLRASRVSGVAGHQLMLDVPFDFHKERLESSKNRKIVEDEIYSILEYKLSIACEVKRREIKKKIKQETGRLTDYNVTSPQRVSTDMTPEELSENIIDVFDGGLPFD